MLSSPVQTTKIVKSSKKLDFVNVINPKNFKFL